MSRRSDILANRAEWTRRLRSGEYKQGYGALKSDRDTSGGVLYCCLGVACEVQYIPSEIYGVDYAFMFDAELVNPGFPDSSPVALTGMPPAIFMFEQFGLVWKDVARLADMNDGQGKSFAEIADYIDTLPIRKKA